MCWDCPDEPASIGYLIALAGIVVFAFLVELLKGNHETIDRIGYFVMHCLYSKGDRNTHDDGNRAGRGRD